MGFTPEDYADDYVDVWPENWTAWELFAGLQTQWRTAGMGGQRTGLDYNVLFHKMDRMNLQRDDYELLEIDIQVMEIEAIATMSKKH